MFARLASKEGYGEQGGDERGEGEGAGSESVCWINGAIASFEQFHRSQNTVPIRLWPNYQRDGVRVHEDTGIIANIAACFEERDPAFDQEIEPEPEGTILTKSKSTECVYRESL